jgi:hypothetical protein
MEEIVRAALDVGLIGPGARRKLLKGLPMGFVYSLPTVSRPIDQLRFDLMEIGRASRLIGLDKPPMAVWLENAVGEAMSRQKKAEALVFAQEADRLLGGTKNVDRVTKSTTQDDGLADSPKIQALAAVETARAALDAAVNHLNEVEG